MIDICTTRCEGMGYINYLTIIIQILCGMSRAENMVSFKVGQKIKYYRKLQGISLQYLSDMVNISVQQLKKYENGDSKIKIDKLFYISLALDVPFSNLACENEF